MVNGPSQLKVRSELRSPSRPTTTAVKYASTVSRMFLWLYQLFVSTTIPFNRDRETDAMPMMCQVQYKRLWIRKQCLVFACDCHSGPRLCRLNGFEWNSHCWITFSNSLIINSVNEMVNYHWGCWYLQGQPSIASQLWCLCFYLWTNFVRCCRRDLMWSWFGKWKRTHTQKKVNKEALPIGTCVKFNIDLQNKKKIYQNCGFHLRTAFNSYAICSAEWNSPFEEFVSVVYWFAYIRRKMTLLEEQRQPLNRTDSPMYIIGPMDARKDDDDEEVGLGFQNTLVSIDFCPILNWNLEK